MPIYDDCYASIWIYLNADNNYMCGDSKNPIDRHDSYVSEVGFEHRHRFSVYPFQDKFVINHSPLPTVLFG